jgi:hypothetical protein
VKAKYRGQTVEASLEYSIGIYKNGSIHSQLIVEHDVYNNNVCPSIADDVQLGIGDTIDIYAHHYTGSEKLL